jgi:4-amino-4-deoxy-L-arabinose transferase-like glycosyltransferase
MPPVPRAEVSTGAGVAGPEVVARPARVRREGRRRFALGLAALALLALAVRTAFTLGVDPEVPEVGDATAYHLLADGLADGEGYVRPFDRVLLDQIRPTAEYPPLFPWAVSLAARADARSVRSQRLAVGLLGAAAVVVIGLLGRRLAGPAVGLVAAGLAAVYPMLFLSDGTLTPETLFVLLVAGVLLVAARVADGRRGTAVAMAGLGLLVGLAALTRTEGLLLLPLVATPVVLLRRDRTLGSRLGLLALAAGATALVVVPWTVRNTVRFDEVVPVSNNIGTAVDGSNCGPTYGGDLRGFWLYTPGGECFEGFDQVALAETNEAVVARDHRTQGQRYAREHLGDVPAVVGVRLLRTWGFWAPRQQTELESLEGRPLGWVRAGTVMYWGLLAFAVVGVAACWRRGRRAALWPLAATALAVCATTVLTYGNQRFRAAAEPALLVLAAAGLVAVVTVARQRLGAPVRPSDGQVHPNG